MGRFIVVAAASVGRVLEPSIGHRRLELFVVIVEFPGRCIEAAAASECLIHHSVHCIIIFLLLPPLLRVCQASVLVRVMWRLCSLLASL